MYDYLLKSTDLDPEPQTIPTGNLVHCFDDVKIKNHANGHVGLLILIDFDLGLSNLCDEFALPAADFVNGGLPVHDFADKCFEHITVNSTQHLIRVLNAIQAYDNQDSFVPADGFDLSELSSIRHAQDVYLAVGERFFPLHQFLALDDESVVSMAKGSDISSEFYKGYGRAKVSQVPRLSRFVYEMNRRNPAMDEYYLHSRNVGGAVQVLQGSAAFNRFVRSEKDGVYVLGYPIVYSHDAMMRNGDLTRRVTWKPTDFCQIATLDVSPQAQKPVCAAE